MSEVNNKRLSFLEIGLAEVRYSSVIGGGSDILSLEKNDIPNPTSISWEGTVLTNAEKNAKGDLFLEFVNKKRKVTVNWQFLTQKQYQSLLNMLRVDFSTPKQNYLFYYISTLNPNNVSYNDQKQPQLNTMVGYLDGKYVGKVIVLDTPIEVSGQELPYTIGYEDITLVFNER